VFFSWVDYTGSRFELGPIVDSSDERHHNKHAAKSEEAAGTRRLNDWPVNQTDREVSAGIIEGCRNGDRAAFHALYQAYKDKVYSISLYFFHGDDIAASDATQQVFLKLITGIKQFRGGSEFSTWLYRMVVNTCLDNAKAGKRREQRSSDVGLERIAVPWKAEEDLERAEVAGRVQAALSSLPPKLRLPVLLRYFEELSYGEMAAAMNCSMGTVASRLHQGHKLLAEKLAKLRGVATGH
jgi:RNA polymerase sigma-70 factor (ECF subfamily)